MSKRDIVIAIIGIIAVTGAFLGGIAYQYEDYESIVKYDYEKSKFTYDFAMPLSPEAAYIWIDWAVAYHQSYIDNKIFTELKPLELHQRYVEMYVEIKHLFLMFDKKWGINE